MSSIKMFVPELMVSDIISSINFYKQLGFELKESEGDENIEFAELRSEAGRLNLKRESKLRSEYDFFEGTKIGGSFSLCFLVEDIHLLYQGLQKAKVINPLHFTECNMQEFSVKDPDGYILTFVQEA